jgi:hypothetical protein
MRGLVPLLGLAIYMEKRVRIGRAILSFQLALNSRPSPPAPRSNSTNMLVVESKGKIRPKNENCLAHGYSLAAVREVGIGVACRS